MNRRFLPLLLTLACTALAQEKTPAPDGEARAIPVERVLAVSGQGYFPVATRLHDGRIAVVLRGGGPHLSIQGRLDMIFSSDEGRTWSKPVVVVDSPIDDRNPALGEAKDGTIVVGFWRTATYDDQGHWDPKSDKERSTWVTRSKDGGKTWSEPAPIDVSDILLGSPYGRIVTLPEGAMLMAIYGYEIRPAGEKTPGDRNHSYVYRSTDNGQTWNRLSEIVSPKHQVNETSLLRRADGKLLAAMRDRGGSVWLAESADEGKTWSEPKQLTPTNIHPADLCTLPDGRILLTAGNRIGPFGVVGLVSDAQGNFDWSHRFALVTDAVSADCEGEWSLLVADDSDADELARTLDPQTEIHSKAAEEDMARRKNAPAIVRTRSHLWAEFSLSMILVLTLNAAPWILILSFPHHWLSHALVQLAFPPEGYQSEAKKALWELYLFLPLFGSMFWVQSIIRRMKIAPNHA